VRGTYNERTWEVPCTCELRNFYKILFFQNSRAIVALTETMIAYRVDISNLMEVSIMGRKLDQDRLENVLQTIRKHDGQYKANDVAKALDLHPQTVARLLASVENHSADLLYEDDRGFLGLFKK
jgi:hypothetical protein